MEMPYPLAQVSPEVLVNVFLAVLLLVLTAFFFRTTNGNTKGSANTARNDSKQIDLAVSGSAAVALAPQPNPVKDQSCDLLTTEKSCLIKEASLAASAPKGALTASAAAAAVRDKSLEAYVGVVKRYSERNGMGFISCEPLKERHGVDVRIFREEIEGHKLQVGDSVRFHIVLGGRALCRADHPWATQVAKHLELGDHHSDPALEPEDLGPGPVPAPRPSAATLAAEDASQPSSGGSLLRADAEEWQPSTKSSEGALVASPSRSRFDPDASDIVLGSTALDLPQLACGNSQLNAGAAEFVPGAAGTSMFQ